MPRVSEEHLERRREQILKSASDLFAERGFARTSMADLIDASGLSTGAVYRYFDGKEALMLAVCRRAFEGMADALAGQRSAREAVAWLLDVAADGRNGRLAGQIWSQATFYPELAAAVAHSHRVLASQLAGLIDADRARTGADGELAAADVADAVLAALGGYRERVAVGVRLRRRDFRRTLEALLALAGA
jgi:TetR/AcrR family transcriptional regulator, transcriptional repressor of aconitase